MDGDTTTTTEVELQIGEVRARTGNRAAREVQELAESIRDVGQLNAILVRPCDPPGAYEIIAGERRWRAMSQLGRPTIRARVFDVGDDRAAILAAKDNLERKDLTPMEEAAVYGELAESGRGAAEIGRRLGRSEMLVRQRLRLLELVPEIRRLVDAERLDLGAAELLAQAPQVVQKKLVPRLKAAAGELGSAYASGPAPIARALVRELIEEHSHDLRDAPWDTADTTMPGGGCLQCPRHTGTQGALFAVLEEADHCLDDICWKANVAEVWKRKSEAAKRQGLVVLDERKSARVLDPYGRPVHDAPYVDLAQDWWVSSKGKHVPVKDLVPVEAPRTLARHPKTGAPVTLVPRADVEAALKAMEKVVEKPAAKASAAKSKGSESDAQRQAREHREASALAQRTHAIAIAQISGALRAKRVDGHVAIEALVASVLHMANEDARRQVCKRRNIEAGTDTAGGTYRYFAALRMELAGMKKNETAMVELGLEVAAAERISFTAYGQQSIHADFAAFGVDIKACRKEAERELREEAKKKAEKGPPTKQPKPAKGARR